MNVILFAKVNFSQTSVPNTKPAPRGEMPQPSMSKTTLETSEEVKTTLETSREAEDLRGHSTVNHTFHLHEVPPDVSPRL